MKAFVTDRRVGRGGAGGQGRDRLADHAGCLEPLQEAPARELALFYPHLCRHFAK